MPVTARVFLDGLVPEARAAGFTAIDRPTDSGLDLYHARGDEVVVTANDAPPYNRVSVKLTVNRGHIGLPTPLFDAICQRFRSEEDPLRARDVGWTWAPPKTESKVQAQRVIGNYSNLAHYTWLLERAKVLRDWANSWRAT